MTFFQENSLIFEAFLCLFKTDMGVSFRLLHLYSAACMLCTARFLLAMVWQLLQNKSRTPIGQEGLCFYIEKQSEPPFLSRRALCSECRVNAGLGQYKACQQNKSLASGQGWLFKKSRTKQIFHRESWNGCMFNNTLEKMQFFQKLFENVWKGKKTYKRELSVPAFTVARVVLPSSAHLTVTSPLRPLAPCSQWQQWGFTPWALWAPLSSDLLAFLAMHLPCPIPLTACRAHTLPHPRASQNLHPASHNHPWLLDFLHPSNPFTKFHLASASQLSLYSLGFSYLSVQLYWDVTDI